MLQDIWTPDVKANQLADVVSGIAPIRSVVNVGSGLADLVLLPLDSYRRDKRVVRGLQKGLASFSKTTALESLRLGARLATGTQVVLEKAEAILGGRLDQNITAEALTEESTEFSPLSRYASQPETLQEGVKGAYRSMRSNLRTTAQTILAVPMEVYERSGNEVGTIKFRSVFILTTWYGIVGSCESCSSSCANCSIAASNRSNGRYEQSPLWVIKPA